MVNISARQGETYNAGGFHSGFLSGKANRPYTLIASGAVLNEERNENGSVGPTRADSTDFKSLGPTQLKGSRSVKSQRRDLQMGEMLESATKTFFNDNRPKFGGPKHYRVRDTMLKDVNYKIHSTATNKRDSKDSFFE